METDAELALRYRAEAGKARVLAETARGAVQEQWLRVAQAYENLAAGVEAQVRAAQSASRRG